MKKAVLFDLDGTLVDSLQDLAASINYALTKLGYPTHELEKFKYFVGDGMAKLVERALPESARHDSIKTECLEVFMNHYKAHYYDFTYVYEGIEEVIDDLLANNIKVAVVSNKAQEMAEKVVTHLFADKIRVVAGKREGFPAKPDPTLTLEIIKELGVEPCQCAFCGDSGMDMATAVNTGALPIGVLWGFRTEEELVNNGAKFIAKNPKDILKFIK